MIKAVAVMETGIQHKKAQKSCQDAALFRMLTKDRLLAVLSDGAGSKPYGERSAKLLTEWTLAYFQKTAAQPFSDTFDAAAFVSYINEQFFRIGLDHEDAGGTLLFLLLENGRYLAGHVGDGIILHKTKKDIALLSGPENGETPNQTFFLPSEAGVDHLRIKTGEVQRGSAFLLSSDGDAPLLFDVEDNVSADACKKLFRAVHELSMEECYAFVQEHMQKLFSKYVFDDQSMILIAYG